MTEEAKFTQGSLFRHISVMSFTASIGLMALFVVDLIDMIFISMLGNQALAAAIGYAGAILFFTTSFGIGMSIAAGAVVARAIGAGEGHEVRHQSATALIYGVVFASIFAAIVWAYVPQALALVGAVGAVAELAQTYLRIIIPSLPLLLIGMVGSAILRAHGDARRAMFATLSGGVVNAVFDPILIFGFWLMPGLGLPGAAIATVLARFGIAFMALYPIIRHHGGLGWPSRAQFVNDFKPLAIIAFPAILTQLATPIGGAYVTRAMAEFGENAVAGMAVIGRVTPVAFGVVFALSGAIGPIVGQNYGAHLADRVREALRDGLLFTAMVVLVMSLVLFLLRGQIAALFGAEGITRDLIFLFCGPLALGYFFVGQIFVANAAFNNLGHPFYSTMINWGRSAVAVIPLVYLGKMFWGAAGVLIGQMAAAVIFAAIAWGLMRRVTAQLEGPDAAIPAKPFQRHRRWVQLFQGRQ